MRKWRRSTVAASLAVGAVAAAVLTGGLAASTASDVGSGPVEAMTGMPTDPHIRFTGRWDTTNPQAYTPHWAGAYLTVGFTGTTVTLHQRDTIDLWASIDGGDEVFFDDVSGDVRLTPRPLPPGEHVLRVNYQVVHPGRYSGDAVFQGLSLDGGARTFALPERQHLIEFVGDSITVGMDTSANALTAYPWLVGEELGADHTAIAQGGACLNAAECVSLEEQFTKLTANEPEPDWDFSAYRADAVVINLGTNDFGGYHVSGAQFGRSYVNLLHTVREKYPDAWIFVMRPFNGSYSAEARAAVDTVAGEGDARVSFIDTRGWLGDGDMADWVHPNDRGHRAIASRLAPIIAERL